MAQGVTKVAQIEALVAQVGALVAEVEVLIAGLMCLNAGLVDAWFLFFVLHVYGLLRSGSKNVSPETIFGIGQVEERQEGSRIVYLHVYFCVAW